MPNVHLYLMACYFHWPGDVINHPDRQRHREGADRARIRCFGLKECLVRLLRPTEIRISIIESTDRGGGTPRRVIRPCSFRLLLSFFSFLYPLRTLSARTHNARGVDIHNLDRRDKMILQKLNVHYFHSRERIILHFDLYSSILRRSRYFILRLLEWIL